MNVCRYKGFSLVVMLRDEHCPPHVHVDAGTWSARFRFSFWHNGVELWDVSLIRIDLLWLCWRDCVRRSGNLPIYGEPVASGGANCRRLASTISYGIGRAMKWS
jgi:hypothetical protein